MLASFPKQFEIEDFLEIKLIFVDDWIQVQFYIYR